jgi:hypothetical protein
MRGCYIIPLVSLRPGKAPSGPSPIRAFSPLLAFAICGLATHPVIG